MLRSVTDKEAMALKNGASWDWQSSTAVDVPDCLDRALSLEQSDSAATEKRGVPLRLLPVDADGSTLTGLEILNFAAGQATFVSNRVFVSGVHYIELRHFSSFKNIKIGVQTEKAESQESQHLVSFEQVRSVLVKLNLQKNCIHFFSREGWVKKSLDFKGKNCKLLVTLADVGNFVGLNPFVCPLGRNPVSALLLSQTHQSRIKLLAQWSFIENFSLSGYENSLEKFLNGGLKVNAQTPLMITEYIHDPELRIIAFQRNGNKHRFLESTNKLTFVSAKSLADMVISESVDQNEKTPLRLFYRKYKQQLFPSTAGTKPSLAELAQSIDLTKIKRITCGTGPANCLIKFLPFADALLVTNGANKARLIFERDADNKFVISPYAFETRDIHCYLECNELLALLKQIEWKVVCSRLSNESAEQCAKAIASIKDSLVRSERHVFFTCPAAQLQSFVRCLLEFLEEPSIDDEPVEEKPVDQDLNITGGIADLFEETSLKRTPSVLIEPTAASNSVESYPLKTDVAFNVLLKLEEALYLQSAKYRESTHFVNRAHTAFARLLSFAQSHLPSQLKQLLDLGIYIDPAMEGELRAFYDQSTTFDFSANESDPVQSAQFIAKLNSSAYCKNIVPLGFSLSHMRAEVYWNNLYSIDCFEQGKFVVSLDKASTVRIYATQFGLTKLFERTLTEKTPFAQLPAFSSFLDLEKLPDANLNYFAPQESSRYKTAVASTAAAPKPKKPAEDPGIDKVMLDELYKMGFSLELCKKALLEVNNSSIDAAVNAILGYSTPTGDGSSNKQGAASGDSGVITLKPMWTCPECTLINDITLNPNDPSTCQACANPAPPEAYMEEKPAEAPKQPMASPPPPQADLAGKTMFPSIESSDTITKLFLFRTKNDNPLNSFVLLVFFKSPDQKSNLLTIRLAYTPAVIQKTLIIDGKEICGASTWLGKTSLHSKQEEKELGQLFQYNFFTQVHSLLPEYLIDQLLSVSSAKTSAVEHNLFVEDICESSHREVTSRAGQTVSLILFASTALAKLNFVNRSNTYKNDTYDLNYNNLVSLDSAYNFFHQNGECAVYTSNVVKFVDPRQLELQTLHDFQNKKILALKEYSSDLFVAVTDHSAELMSLSVAQKPADPATMQPTNTSAATPSSVPATTTSSSNTSSKATKQDSQLGPKHLLTAFKKSIQKSLRITKHANLLEVPISKGGFSYHLMLNTVESQQPIRASLQLSSLSEIVHFCVDAYVTLPKSDPLAAELIRPCPKIKTDFAASTSSINSCLPLMAHEFRGSRFSKSLHLSQMLFRDGEFYSTTTFTDLFLFENIYEQVMSIRRVHMTLYESLLQDGPVGAIAVFIFSDYSLTSQIRNLKLLTKSQFIAAWTNNQLPQILKPALFIDLAKLTNSAVSAELETEWLGRYVAFLPLAKVAGANSSQTFSVDYFGVEGEYMTDQKSPEQSEPSSANLVATFPVEAALSAGESTQPVVFRVRNYAEKGNEISLCLYGETLISTKNINQLEFSIGSFGPERHLIKLLPRVYSAVDNRVIKLKEEILGGSTASIEQIIRDYYQNFTAKQETQENPEEPEPESLDDFLLLLTYLIEIYKLPMAQLISKIIDWPEFFAQNVLNLRPNSNNRLLQAFVEKIANFDSTREKLKESIGRLLDELPKIRTSPAAQKLFWSLVHAVLVADSSEKEEKKQTKAKEEKDQPEKKEPPQEQANAKSADKEPQLETKAESSATQSTVNDPFKSKLSSFFTQTARNIHSLYKFEQKVLDILGTQTSINGFFLNSQTTATVEAGLTTAHCNAPKQQYIGLEQNTSNYREIYCLLDQTCALTSVTANVTNLKYNEPFTVELYTINAANQFELRKSKTFDPSFCHQVLKQDKLNGNDHFGFCFDNNPLIARLVKLVIKVNYLVSFHYSNAVAAPSFTFSFYGNKASASNQSEEQTIFIGLKEQLGPNARSIESSRSKQPAVAKATEKQKESQPETANNQAALEESKESVVSAIRKVTETDLINKNETGNRMAGVLNEYKRHCELFSKSQSQGNKKTAISYANNYAYWLNVCNEFVQNITCAFSDAEIGDFFSAEAKLDICFTLFYDLFIFSPNSSAKSPVSDLRSKLLAQLSPEQLKQLKSRLTDEFLKEPDSIYLSQFQQFANKICATSMITDKWFALVGEFADKLLQFDAKSDAAWRALYLDLLFIGKKLETAKGSDSPADVRPKALTLVLFILEHDLLSVCFRFKDILNRLISLLIPDLTSLSVERIEEIQPIIGGLRLRKMTELVAVPLELLENRLASQLTSGNKLTAVQAGALGKFANILVEMVNREIDASSNKDAGEFLVLSLSHLARVVDILSNNQKLSNENSPQKSLIPANFTFNLLSYLSKQEQINEALLRLASQITFNPHITVAAFKSLMDFVLKLPASSQQYIAYFIDRDFSQVVKQIKDTPVMAEVAQFLVEFNTNMIADENRRTWLMNKTDFIDLCVIFNLVVINGNSGMQITKDAVNFPLKPQLFVPLFTASIDSLIKTFNYGGADNFLNLPRDLISYLELLSTDFHILARGNSQAGGGFYTALIEAYRVNPNSSTTSFDFMIQWLMINHNINATDYKTPAGIFVKKLYNDLAFLFKALFKDEEFAKTLLNSVCRQFKELFDLLSAKVKSKKTGYMTLLLLENSMEFFEGILDEVCASPKLTAHFLQQNRGLELIFGSFTSAEQSTISSSSSLSAKLKALYSQDKTEEAVKSNASVSVRNKQEFEQELGANLKMTTDNSSVTAPSTKEWHVNKQGRSNNIFSFTFPANEKNIKIQFKLSAKMEMRNIKVGVLVNRNENYLVAGPPSYIKLNGVYDDEKGQARKIYIGELVRADDSGYTGVSNEVFVLNLNKLSGDALKAIANLNDGLEFNEFELVIGKPVIALVDKISSLVTRCTSTLSFCFSFVSAEGFSHAKVNLEAGFQKKIETTFRRSIELLFNSESSAEVIDQYLEALPKSASDSLYTIIESQLDALMNNFDVKLSRFLMIMSQKNKKMSISIFRFLKKNLEKNDLFYGLIEKILCRTFSHSFFLEFFEFGATRMADSPGFGNRFLEVLGKHLLELVRHYGPKGNFPVPVTRAFFQTLLRKYNENPFNFNYERAIVLIIYLLNEQKIFAEFDEAPYLSGEVVPGVSDLAQHSPVLARSFLDLILERISLGENNLLHIVVYLAYKYPAADEALRKNHIIDRICQVIKEDQQHKIAAHVALQALVKLNTHSQELLDRKFDQELLNLLEQAVQVESFAKNEEHIQAFLKSIFLLFSQNQSRLQLLEQRLYEMIKRLKQNKVFIDKVLLGFFELKHNKLVRFFYSRQKETQQTAAPAQLALNADTVYQIPSCCLIDEKLKTFTKICGDVLDEKTQGLLKKFSWKKEIETSYESEDFSQQLEEKLFTKNPLLYVINGENNGKNILLVLFAATGFEKSEGTNRGRIPNTSNCFIAIIEPETHIEYKLPVNKDQYFLEYIGDDPSYKGIVLNYEDQEKLRIPLSEESGSMCDLYPLKPINETPQNYEFPYELHMNGLEIFILTISDEVADNASSSNYFYDQLIQTPVKNNLISSLESVYSDVPIFELPAELSIKGLETGLKTTVTCPEKQKKLKEFAESIVVLGSSKPIVSIENKEIESHYNPQLPIFDIFVEKGGMRYLIKKITDSNNVAFFKTQEVAQNWTNLMGSILKLETLSGFLSSMIQDKDFFTIVFEIYTGDQKSTRDWVQTEINISWLILKKLASMLSNSESLELRVQLFKLDVLEMILEKLANLTNDIKRKFDDAPEVAEPQPKAEEPTAKEENYAREVRKKKGVGYDKEGSGKKWIINEYLAKKKQRNDFIIDILKLFNLLFDRDYPNTEEINQFKDKWFRTICESCFLPVLEGAFKCSSLHEMAKDYDLYKIYCEVLLTLAQREQLKELLKPIPKTFKPVQLESLLMILLKQEENTLLFKKFSDTEAVKKEKIESIELSDKILQTISQVKSHYADHLAELEDKEEHISEENLHKIEELPLNEKYKLAVKDLRFDLTNMKANGEYSHHYASNINSEQKSTSISRGVRLAQEIADLTASLPIDSYNAIFVRSDENRLDLMKGLIAGAEGTPYANGLFEYHVYLPADYPNTPPKCNLETTGSGEIRFNPNLYSCGKVCLSLLGTWRGNASENWDPKISNLLQLFLSIQSVVMSEEVYFNEPGYEHEAGTDEGEARNEGYSNIVRFGNIKHAMIGQIKKPSAGFEDVIRRHFYIKKDVILKECGTWVKMAEARKAAYTGLVSDHNHKIAQNFSENPKNYINELQQLIKDLEKTFKDLISSIEISVIFSSKKKKASKKKQKETKHVQNLSNANTDSLFNEIDVNYDKEAVQEEFDASSTKVADRWSRYIGVLGMDAVKKQSKAKVLLAGVSATGLEVAKNLVLSGLNRLDLVDWKNIEKSDLAVNFYAEEGSLGTNRATAILQKLRQLNCYVKVETQEVSDKTDWKMLSDFDLVVICDVYPPVTDNLVNAAAKLNKKLIIAESVSVCSRIFCDLGNEFEVNDRDGEEPAECFIKEIDYEKNRIILLEKSAHLLRVGDFIRLEEVVAKTDASLKPLNNAIFTCKEFHKMTEIEVTQKLKDFEHFERNGKIREIKVPVKVVSKRFSDETCNDLDPNLAVHDFAKMTISPHIGNCFKFKQIYERKHGKPVTNVTIEEMKKILKESFGIDYVPSKERSEQADQPKNKEETKQEQQKHQKPENKEENKEKPKADDKTGEELSLPETKPNQPPEEPKPINDPFIAKLKQFIVGAFSTVHSIAAFVGGVAAQEVIKGITNKYMPINQALVCDFEELLDESLLDMSDEEFVEKLKLMNKNINSDANFYLKEIFGEKLFDHVRNAKLFMVGAGAIGCELLKNLSMVRLGSGKGQITLTDPDNIELSNLSRQFLFREKHISKPKSLVAAKVIASMVPEYAKGRIVAKLDKVCEETEEIFTNDFFKAQTMCLNALDNIRARVYMDQRCVRNSVPLLESGTLGPKCHLQVIIPFITENYGQVQDAKEEGSIPICTLKMFPEESIHSMEWAKDKFEDFFNQKPKNLIRILEELKKSNSLDALDFKVIKKAAKFFKNKPKSIDDCVVLARKWFQKYFNHNVRQLLHVYPLDFKNKDGKLFWSLPKRPPHPIEFDVKNPLHKAMITASVKLMMSNWCMDPKLLEGFDLEAALAKVVIEPFVPKDSAAQQIKKSVEKGNAKEEPEEENPEDVQKKQDEQNNLTKEVKEKITKEVIEQLSGKIKEEIFEKDDDKNGHIDFITAMTNLRSLNYQLPEMEWIAVKLKAGRIVPALATTTAAIAGLQTVEAVKILKRLKIEKYKNVFMNMSVPIIAMSEPGPVVKSSLTPELKVSVWDIWNYDFTASTGRTLANFFDWIKNNYKITPKDLMKGSKPIFLSIINQWGDFKDKQLDDLLDLEPEESAYVNVICFHEDPKIALMNVPPVKVCFKK